MTTTLLSPLPVQRFYDNNNNPLVGGQLFSYVAGTSTPQATYTDSTGGTANTNPVILNSRGEANVWIIPGQAYKFVLEDSLNNVIWTTDQVSIPITTNYTAPGTGAVTRTVTSKLADVLYAADFGVDPSGATDTTVSFQNAITAAIAGNGVLYVAPGVYKHSGLTISGGIKMLGSGPGNCFFNCSNLTGTGIAINTTAPIVIDGFSFNSTGTVTAGAAITVTATGSANTLSIFRNLTFNSQFDCIHTTNAYEWSIERCIFNLYADAAVWVENDYNADAGDSVITNCVFAGATTVNSIGIYQVSSGGLRIQNNKLVQGGYGYIMTLAHLAQTGDLLINGNSFENMLVAGIQMNRIVGGAQDMHFTSVEIVGNQFLGTTTGIPINLNDLDVTWLANVTITGNVIDVLHAGTPAYAILVNGASGFSIVGNTITGNTGGTAGIGIGSGATSGVIASNTLVGFTTPIINNSPSTYIAKKVYQVQTASITCSSSFGATGTYTGTLAITFPTGLFLQSPVVTATAIGGTSAISAVVLSVTGSGCTVQAFAGTNGSGVPVFVRAEADY